jgi:hypothetical protein
MVAIGQKGGMGSGKEGWRMGYWCSLTIFFSYKYTTEGEDILITFVFPLILTRPEKKSQGRHFAFIISIKYLFIC